MEDFDNKVVKGIAWEAAARLIVQIASWISTIWVARLLSPDDYGLVAISGIFTGLCLTISVMGLTNALINKKELAPHDTANIFWSNCVLAAIIYYALYFFAPMISKYYNAVELEALIRVAGLMVVIAPLSVVPRALLMRDLNFKAIALITMVSNLLVTVITLSLAFLGWGYWSLVISTVIAQVFSLVALMFVAKYIPTLPKNISSVLPLYRYGFSILGARLVGYLNNHWATIILGSSMGKTTVGHFEMANTLAKMPMTKIGEVINAIVFSAFSRIQDDLVKTKQVFLTMHKYLFMLVAPMFIGIAFTAEEIVLVLIGEKWIAAVVPVQIICIVNILSGSAMIIPRVLEGLGNASASFKYQMVLAVTAPIAMLFGVQWGVNEMLVAWACTIPLGYLYLLRVLFKSIDMTFREFFGSVSATFISLLIMALAILLVDYCFIGSSMGMFYSLIIKVFTGAVFYALPYFVFARDDLKKLYFLARYRRLEN